MKFLAVIFLGLLATVLAKPADQKVSVSQDTIGNYKVNINANGLSKIEQGNADGSVSGSYSYLDSTGVLRTVQYTAGADGFRAFGDHLPVAPVDTNVPVQETPEILRARAQHFAALQNAGTR